MRAECFSYCSPFPELKHTHTQTHTAQNEKKKKRMNRQTKKENEINRRGRGQEEKRDPGRQLAFLPTVETPVGFGNDR